MRSFIRLIQAWVILVPFITILIFLNLGGYNIYTHALAERLFYFNALHAFFICIYLFGILNIFFIPACIYGAYQFFTYKTTAFKIINDTTKSTLKYILTFKDIENFFQFEITYLFIIYGVVIVCFFLLYFIFKFLPYFYEICLPIFIDKKFKANIFHFLFLFITTFNILFYLFNEFHVPFVNFIHEKHTISKFYVLCSIEFFLVALSLLVLSLKNKFFKKLSNIFVNACIILSFFCLFFLFCFIYLFIIPKNFSILLFFNSALNYILFFLNFLLDVSYFSIYITFHFYFFIYSLFFLIKYYSLLLKYLKLFDYFVFYFFFIGTNIYLYLLLFYYIPFFDISLQLISDIPFNCIFTSFFIFFILIFRKIFR